jgi:hypothetical protein
MHTERLIENRDNHLTAELAEGHELSVEDRLADLGLTEEQITAAVEIVEQETERLAFHRAAQVLRRIFLHLIACGPQTAALARALGFGEESLDSISSKLGTSKQNLGNIIALIRPHLGPLVAERERKPFELPPAPHDEVWLSLPQSRKLSGLAAQAINQAIRDGRLHWVVLAKRIFIEEGSLLAWQAERQIEAARSRLTPGPTDRTPCQTTTINQPPSKSSDRLPLLARSA